MEEAKIFRKAYDIFVKYFGSETNKNLQKEIQPGLFTNRKPLPNSNKIKMKILLQKVFQKSEIL